MTLIDSMVNQLTGHVVQLSCLLGFVCWHSHNSSMLTKTSHKMSFVGQRRNLCSETIKIGSTRWWRRTMSFHFEKSGIFLCLFSFGDWSWKNWSKWMQHECAVHIFAFETLFVDQHDKKTEDATLIRECWFLANIFTLGPLFFGKPDLQPPKKWTQTAPWTHFCMFQMCSSNWVNKTFCHCLMIERFSSSILTNMSTFVFEQQPDPHMHVDWSQMKWQTCCFSFCACMIWLSFSDQRVTMTDLAPNDKHLPSFDSVSQSHADLMLCIDKLWCLKCTWGMWNVSNEGLSSHADGRKHITFAIRKLDNHKNELQLRNNATMADVNESQKR